MKFIPILFLTFFNCLYPIVLVKGSVDNKYIFSFSGLDYTIEITGTLGSFVFDSFDTNYINDFEIKDEKIIDTVTKKENEETVVSKKIIYKLTPLRKGKLVIPECDVKYFSVDNGVLKSESKKVARVNVSVISLSFIFVIIFLFTVIIAVVIKIIYEEEKIRKIKKDKKNLDDKINNKFRKN